MADKRAYFKLDIGYLQNPKIALLLDDSPTAVLLHIGSIGYAAQHLTDGVVPVSLIRRMVGASAEDVALLFEVGLWVDRGKGAAEVRDYLEHQRSAREAKGATAKAKKAAETRWDATKHAPEHASEHATENAKAMPIEREKERENIEGPASKKRAAQLPDGWIPDAKVRAAMMTEYPHLSFKVEHEKFCDHWRSKGEARVDWNATWRNWIRNAAKFDAPKGAGRPPSLDENWMNL